MGSNRLAADRRLLFVGSGLSIALGISSWPALLHKVARGELPPLEADRVCALLKTPGHEYLAADEIARLIGRPRLGRCVTAIIREEQDRVIKSGNLHSLTTVLSDIGSAGIITTNWDTLLQRITGYRPLVWPSDSTNLANALRDGQPFVLYLHGNIATPPLVITSHDCSHQASTFERSAFRLETTLAAHTLTVIGSSYPDTHLNDLYAAASRMVGHNSRVRVSLFTEEDKNLFRRDHPDLAKGSVLVTYRTYDDMPRALRELAAETDSSELLSELSLLRPGDEPALYRIVSLQPYSFLSTSELRDLYLDTPDRGAALLDTSAMILLDDPKLSDKVTAGILATLLSTASDSWYPDGTVLDALERLCTLGLTSAPNIIGIIEPLVFALARHGRRDNHKKYVGTILQDDDWRIADISRIGEYYENRHRQVKAMKRHLNDKRRDGILRANDVTRLLNLLAFVKSAALVQTVKKMTNVVIDVLYKAGEDTLAKRAIGERDRILRDRRGGPISVETVPP